MSITRTDSFPCPCGAVLTIELCDSLNADRHPLLRKSIIDRELHAVHCAACDRTIVVEHRFLYVDLERLQVLGVYRRNDRDEADVHARHLEDTFERWFRTDAPAWIRERASRCLVRACFGLEELREKLVADEAGLDDYRLEALKCIVLAQDPRYREAEVATLRLDRVDGDMLELVPVNANEQRTGGLVQIPRAELDAVPLEQMRRAFPRMAVGPHVSLLRLGMLRP